MLATQNLKFVQTVLPASQTSTTATSIAIDTEGWGCAAFILNTGSIATNGAISAFSITECATSGGSYTAVSSSTPSTLIADDGDGQSLIIHVNLRNKARLRYLKVVATNGNGATLLNVQCVLGDPLISPNAATERGLAAAGNEVFIN